MNTISLFSGCLDTLSITNDGPDIRRTNFWTGGQARQGGVIVNWNIDLRILLPESLNCTLREMATGKSVIVSRGPWPLLGGEHALEIMFDDKSSEPFQITIEAGTVGLLPAPGDQFQVTVWTRGKNDQAIRRLSLPGRYRHVPTIPCLKPWSSHHGLPLHN